MTNDHDRYLCFSLGAEEYAIPLLSVKEVIALPDITPVPQTVPYFLGIMNLRGQVISVTDLRLKLSIKPNQTSETAVIICDLAPNCIGFVVDSINSVMSSSPEDISKKPDIQSQVSTDYIQSIYRNKDRLVLILDIAKTVTSSDHQLMARATARSPVKLKEQAPPLETKEPKSEPSEIAAA